MIEFYDFMPMVRCQLLNESELCGFVDISTVSLTLFSLLMFIRIEYGLGLVGNCVYEKSC